MRYGRRADFRLRPPKGFRMNLESRQVVEEVKVDVDGQEQGE